MDEEVLKQLTLLKQIVETTMDRMEQIIKFHSEKVEAMEREIAEMRTTTESLKVTNEALLRSLSENDSQVDDLARITAAQMQLLKAAQAQNQAAPA